MARKVVDYLISMLRWVLAVLIALSAIVASVTGELKDLLLIVALFIVWLMAWLPKKGE